MKVALLNDLSVAGPTTSGFGSGAELTSARWRDAGTRLGHDVTIIQPEFCRPELLAEFDLLITKNVTAFTRDQLRAVMQRPYVAWPSDYAWSKWRLFFSFQESHKRHPDLAFWREFFTKSKLNVFLSPLHREAYEFVMPELADHPTFLSPPPVDVDAWKPHKDGWVKDTACTINGGLEFKGLHQNLTWASTHPNTHFSFIGALREQVNLPPNAEHIGHLSEQALIDVVGRAETYVELPNTCQPYNRTSIEGFFASKRVVTNKLMGAASWSWFKSGDKEDARAALRNALPDLWTRLEQEVAT